MHTHTQIHKADNSNSSSTFPRVASLTEDNRMNGAAATLLAHEVPLPLTPSLPPSFLPSFSLFLLLFALLPSFRFSTSCLHSLTHWQNSFTDKTHLISYSNTLPPMSHYQWNTFHLHLYHHDMTIIHLSFSCVSLIIPLLLVFPCTCDKFMNLSGDKSFIIKRV